MEKFESLFHKYKIVYLIFVGLLLWIFPNPWLFSFTLILLLISCIILSKLDFCHPYCNVLPIFVLYEVAFPILNYYGIVVFKDMAITPSYYALCWLATSCFVIFLGKIKIQNYNLRSMKKIDVNHRITFLFYILLSFIAIFASIYAIIKGYSSKYEISQNMNFIIKSGMMSYVSLIPISLFLLFSNKLDKKYKIIVLVSTFVLMFFGMGTFGERDYVLNYVLIIFLLFLVYRKVSTKIKIAIVVVLLVFVSYSSSLKMLFSPNNIYTSTEHEQNIVLRLLNSDFASQGFNFNFLIYAKNSYDRLYGATYIYDALSPFDDFIVPVKKLNANSWYQSTFWSHRKNGLGFTIIGEGYINFGIIGIVLSMFILATITKFLYKKSVENSYWLILYFAFISYFMYACRGSLANIISPMFKYYMYIYLLLYVLSKFKLKGEVLYFGVYDVIKIRNEKSCNIITKIIGDAND